MTSNTQSQSTALVQTTPEKSVGFAQVNSGNQPRRISINPVDERVTSLIAEGAIWRGEIVLQEGIKVDGSLEGSLDFGLDGGLCIVSKSGYVEGTITGPKALILGRVKGDVLINGPLVIAHTAHIEGTVRYGSVTIYDGANIDGTMQRMTAGNQIEFRPEVQEPTPEHQADVVPLQRHVG